MGAHLIFVPSETNKWTGDSFPRVSIEHWRAYKPDNSKLIIIDAECCMFIVDDLTESQFHELNHENKDLCTTYEFKQLNLICDICFGRGLLDWVEKATRRKIHPPLEAVKYKRDKNKPTRLLYDDYYVSSPRQKKGEQLCSGCQGTGLHLFSSKYRSRILT